MTNITDRMPTAPTLVAISGSLRRGSLNSLLLTHVSTALSGHGVIVERADLSEYSLPHYNADIEEESGVPDAAQELRRRIQAAHGIVLACPEYNGSITGVLKNALDWCSRPTEGLGGLQPFAMKPVLLVSASISPFGGVRALGHLRAIAAKMGSVVFPNDLAVAYADTALSEKGLESPQSEAMVQQLAASFSAFLKGG